MDFRILDEISASNYSEIVLIQKLLIIQEHDDEEEFISSFLRFVVDCSGYDFSQITAGMYFDDILAKCVFQVPNETISIYHNRNLFVNVEKFLFSYIVQTEAFLMESWRYNVLGLLRAMTTSTSVELNTTGLYFCFQILYELASLRNTIRMEREVQEVLLELCLKLMDIYNLELLNEDNFSEISKMIIFLIEKYPEIFLNENPANFKNLTGLLFIVNNQIKANVLKSIVGVSESLLLTVIAQESIKAELVSLRSLLISFCHRYPINVTTTAMSLILRLGREYVADKEDKDKLYLLLASSNKKLQDLALEFFLATYERYNGEDETTTDSNSKMFKVLDEFITKYSDAIKQLPAIVETLSKDLPDFVEIFMYILATKSALWSKIVPILAKIISCLDSEGSASKLMKIPSVLSSVLQKVESVHIYMNILQSLTEFSSDLFKEIDLGDLEKLIRILTSDFVDKPFDYYMLLHVALMIRRIEQQHPKHFTVVVSDLFIKINMENVMNETGSFEKLCPLMEAFKPNLYSYLTEGHLEDVIKPMLRNRKIDGYSIRVESILILNAIKDGLEKEDHNLLDSVFDDIDVFVVKLNSNYFDIESRNFDPKDVVIVSESTFDLLKNIKFQLHGTDYADRLTALDSISTKFVNFILKAFDRHSRATSYEIHYKKIFLSLSELMEFAPEITQFKNLHRLWTAIVMHPTFQTFLPQFLERVYRNDRLTRPLRQEFLVNILVETLYGLNFMNGSVEQPTKFLLQEFLKAIRCKENHSTVQSIKAAAMRLLMAKIGTYMEKVMVHELSGPVKGEHRFKVVNHIDGALDLDAHAKTYVIRVLNKLLSTQQLSDTELKSVRKITTYLNTNRPLNGLAQ